MADPQTGIIALSDYAFGRTRTRLEGLTDDEYVWRHLPDCWSIQPGQVGHPHDGLNGPPEAERFTSIGWLLFHLIETYGGSRNAEWLGLDQPSSGFDCTDATPATAADALMTLERAHTHWKGLLEALPPEAWWQPLGAIAGPYGDSDKASYVLHQIDEHIHHGAQLGLMRDLYRHTR